MRHSIIKGFLPSILMLTPVFIFLLVLYLFFNDQMTMNEYDAAKMIEQSSLSNITVLKGDLCPNKKCMHLLYEKQDRLDKTCVFVNPPNPILHLDLSACEHNELHVSALNRYLQEDKQDGLLNQ